MLLSAASAALPNELPEDVIKLNADLRDESGPVWITDAQTEAPPLSGDAHHPVSVSEVPKLEHWTVQAHIYSEEIAGSVSILGALFGGSGKRAKVGAVHEAKRFRIDRTPDGREVEIGVAVRLAVAVTEWDTKFEVSLPNIAASAQLNGFDGRIGIEVVGYAGPLGDLLPAPRELSVTTCADYLQAFSKIQAQVFGAEGLGFQTPTALAFDNDQQSSQ